jgi:hypothetical protein
MSVNAADLMVPTDPLLALGPPERVNYATGVLLQAEDFRDEQTYHRARLATALSYLLGHGTLAGLAVRAPAAEDNDLQLRVEGGLALDRHGRLIEVTEPWCTRLARWFAAQETAELRSAVRRTPAPVAVIADLFLSLADCGRGKTPSFAQGPFDALDALVPARLAEQPSFELVLRAEAAPIPAPANSWPEAAASADAKLAAVLGSYRLGHGEGVGGGLAPFAEHVAGHDAGAVLLARIAIPVTLAADAPPSQRPLLDLGQRVQVDNRVRPFIYLPGKWLGAEPRAVPLTEP